MRVCGHLAVGGDELEGEVADEPEERREVLREVRPVVLPPLQKVECAESDARSNT